MHPTNQPKTAITAFPVNLPTETITTQLVLPYTQLDTPLSDGSTRDGRRRARQSEKR